jgi:hypothetical protein
MCPRNLVCLALALPLVGCPSKEAEDPRAILGDWTEHRGADGTTGARGKTQPPSTKDQAAPGALASKLECEAAARRIEELALELAVKEAADAQERADLELRRKKMIGSSGHEDRVRLGGEECLSRDTAKSEALCIARARSELDVDRCAESR